MLVLDVEEEPLGQVGGHHVGLDAQQTAPLEILDSGDDPHGQTLANDVLVDDAVVVDYAAAAEALTEFGYQENLVPEFPGRCGLSAPDALGVQAFVLTKKRQKCYTHVRIYVIIIIMAQSLPLERGANEEISPNKSNARLERFMLDSAV